MCANMSTNFTYRDENNSMETELDQNHCSTETTTIENNATIINNKIAVIISLASIYYTPILVIFGVVGNLVSFFVFSRSEVRSQTTSVYLRVLAISDALFLLQLVPPWLEAIRVSTVFYHPAVCYPISYFSYVTSMLSSWIVVAFTIERYVAVLHPLTALLIFTVERAENVVIIIGILALTMNVPVLLFVSPSFNCTIATERLTNAEQFNAVDTMMSFLIPLTMLMLMNLRIMFAIYTMEEVRRQLLNSDVSERPRAHSQNRITNMLLAVSTAYIVLNLPAYTTRILAYSFGAIPIGDHWAGVQQMSLILFNTTFGINFWLYCLSGKNFRRMLWQTIPFLRALRRRRQLATVARPTRTQGLSVSSSYASAGAEATYNVARGRASVAPGFARRSDDSHLHRWNSHNRDNNWQQRRDDIEMTTNDLNSNRARRRERRVLPNFRKHISHSPIFLRSAHRLDPANYD